jgi:hypothetical protein
MVVSGADSGGGRIVVTAQTPTSAGDVFVVDPSGAATPRSDFSADLRATGHVRVPVEIEARSSDGRASVVESGDEAACGGASGAVCLI